MGIEKGSVGGPHLLARCSTRAATKNALVNHEFAVVFTQRAFWWPKPRIRREIRCRPLPDVAPDAMPRQRSQRSSIISIAHKVARDRMVAKGNFMLGFGWQSCVCPAGEGIRLIIADVDNWSIEGNRLRSAKRISPPFIVFLPPIKWVLPSLTLCNRIPFH
jgi:hypothetical protein